MSDTMAAAAPVSTDTAAATTDTAAANGSLAATSATADLAALDEDTRKTVEAKGWKTVGDAAKSYKELFAKFNDVSTKAVTPPAPDAEAKEWDAYYAKIGRPETPEGYDFKLPEGLPEDLPYDAERATQYKDWSHKAGLTPRQAQQIHDLAALQAVSDFKAQQAALTEKIEASHAEIVKAWGAKESDSYAQNLQFTDRFIKNNGGDELMSELKANGLITEEGVVLSPRLAQAMAKAGRALYAEDQFATGAQSQPKRPPAEIHFPPEKDVFRQNQGS